MMTKFPVFYSQNICQDICYQKMADEEEFVGGIYSRNIVRCYFSGRMGNICILSIKFCIFIQSPEKKNRIAKKEEENKNNSDIKLKEVIL